MDKNTTFTSLDTDGVTEEQCSMNTQTVSQYLHTYTLKLTSIVGFQCAMGGLRPIHNFIKEKY